MERFLRAHDAVTAWTAELAGRPVGHVCRLGPPHGSEDAAAMNGACARAHGCTVDELGWVATLFVGLDARGLGVGRAAGHRGGRHPERRAATVPGGAPRARRRAGAVRVDRGQEVLRIRPAWLREAAGDEGPDVRVMVLPA